jgi:hypothetical protein
MQVTLPLQKNPNTLFGVVGLGDQLYQATVTSISIAAPQ